jgi:pimeloyl-ACP methyl ester carboxylesterase
MRSIDEWSRIVQWTELDDGGHFPAIEEPGPLVADMQAFFRKIGVTPAIRVRRGRSG